MLGTRLQRGGDLEEVTGTNEILYGVGWDENLTLGNADVQLGPKPQPLGDDGQDTVGELGGDAALDFGGEGGDHSLETGAEHGMWTYQRYRTWLDTRKSWYIPGKSAESPESDAAETASPPARPQAFPIASKSSKAETKLGSHSHTPGTKPSMRIEIEPSESEFGKILKRPGE